MSTTPTSEGLLPVEQRHRDLAQLVIPAAVIFADAPDHVADLRRRAAEHIARFERDHLAQHTAPAVEGEMAAERLRQVQEEGFSAERDDAYTDYSLARAAAAYAMIAGWPDEVERSVAETTFPDGHGLTHKMLQLWPGSWDSTWLKPKTRRADLVRAGALIIAEIERLDREAARG